MQNDTTNSSDRLAIALEAVAALRGALKEAERELAQAQKAAEAERLRLALAEQAAQHKAEVAALKAAHKEELKRVKAEAAAKCKTARKGKTAGARRKKSPAQDTPAQQVEAIPEAIPEATPAEQEAPFEVQAAPAALGESLTPPVLQTAPAFADVAPAAFRASVGDSADRAYLFPSEAAQVMQCLGQRREGVISCLSDGAVSLLSMLDGAVRAEGYSLPDDFVVELAVGKKVLFSLVRAGLSFRLMEGA